MYTGAFTLRNLERVASVERIARDCDVSIAALALAWLRQHPLVTATIVSPRRTKQWDAVTEALGTELDGDLAERISAVFG
jgi:aryl-alcohol dehydrogenase-like predicted oxidoreductase